MKDMAKRTERISNAKQVCDVHTLEAYVTFLVTECRIPVAEYKVKMRHPWIRLRRKPTEKEILFLAEQGLVYQPKSAKGSNRPKEVFVYISNS